MKTYKGFDKDLRCRGFQYEIGKEYEEKKAEACECGFHGCENPLDVFAYYPPCDGNRYCEVEQSGELSNHVDGSKVASTKIKIGVELGLKGLIQAGVSFILDKVNWKDDAATNTGDYSAATNTGNRSAATNTGNRSAATNTGDYSAATNTGICSAATNTGDYSAATNTGNRSAATNTGDYPAATNTGICSAATNTGNCSAATNTGSRSAATNTGIYSAAEVADGGSVAIVTGYQSKAKAELGSAIVVAERGDWDGETYPLINIKAAIVDGEKIKANTWYTLKNGEFVECD